MAQARSRGVRSSRKVARITTGATQIQLNPPCQTANARHGSAPKYSQCVAT
jgi:hypothetical protein